MMAIEALVFKKDGKQRRGKGFSRGELKKSGLSPKEALKFRIPVDLRRVTVHEENVSVIKQFLESRKVQPRPERRRKSKS